jgi:isopentenyl diphosphate isomerase/L-lactate dehydrogenase-like FMN-dependent dehydrogenase
MGVTAVREFARHRLRRAAYVGVPRAVVEQMMQQEAMRVRLRKRLSLGAGAPK